MKSFEMTSHEIISKTLEIDNIGNRARKALIDVLYTGCNHLSPEWRDDLKMALTREEYDLSFPTELKDGLGVNRCVNYLCKTKRSYALFIALQLSKGQKYVGSAQETYKELVKINV